MLELRLQLDFEFSVFVYFADTKQNTKKLKDSTVKFYLNFFFFLYKRKCKTFTEWKNAYMYLQCVENLYERIHARTRAVVGTTCSAQTAIT